MNLLKDPVHILILADESATAQRWLEQLKRIGAMVWTDATVVPAGSLLDVVLTNQGLESGDLGAETGTLGTKRDSEPPIPEPRSLTSQLAQGDAGLIAVGVGGVADVSLPSDCTGREIRLACQLLAQIVRLRRSRRQGKHVHKVLSHLALTDPLTGLPNRRTWEGELKARLASDLGVRPEAVGLRKEDGELRDQDRGAISQQATSPLSPRPSTLKPQASGLKPPPSRTLYLGLLDLDHFKQINDDLGHATGDGVLRAAAEALAVAMRQGDFVARLGGDEFGVLLTGVDLVAAQRVLERVRVAGTANLANIASRAVTASAGLAMRRDQDDAQSLYARADQALATAKRQGRDQLRFET